MNTFDFQTGIQGTTENPMFGLNTEHIQGTDKRVLKAPMLAFVVLRGGENRRAKGKPPTQDWQPLPCHAYTRN